MKQKEFHLYLNAKDYKDDICVDYQSTLLLLREKSDYINTTQSTFLSPMFTTHLFENEYKIFIHSKNIIEIKLGNNECTNRWIRESHNIEKLMWSGELKGIFDKGGELI